MRTWWILPNRDQNDDILASDGKATVPLRQILDPKLRPEGFSHGVPAELLEKCGPNGLAEILFAQRFSGWNGGKELFSVSTVAGKDSSGREVHLGLLFILEPHERLRFELPFAGLSEEDRPYARALIHRMTSSGRDDLWAQSVRELSELPADGGSATNVGLDRSVVRFHSLYVAGPGGSIRKGALSRFHVTAIALLILFAVVSGWLAVHACERSFRPAIGTGVVTWRLS